MSKEKATFERISGGNGLVVKNNIRQFLDIVFPDKEIKPMLDKLEILPKKGECHITIKFLPAVYVVPYAKVLEAVGKVLLGNE